MLITTDNISKSYTVGGSSIDVLNDISLTIDKGEFVAIMGQSGSGKSTLMYILGLLISPTSGTYLLNGDDVSTLPGDTRAHLRNGKIGFVFQSFHLLPGVSVIDNVKLPLLYSKQNGPSEQAYAKELLEKVGLSDRLHHKPNQLSGGQQQRVAIARALINKPDVLFADEPTGNLDSKTGAEIMDIFDTLNKEGKTIIMVTHEKSIARHAKRIIHIQDGRVV
ncbi:macrolide ABC transporter ATP-binding protein [Candidatus Roizmanbacteria bacterium RIFCSPLOWO2_01_FULL_45_11]|uniref:Macrolide ABC transporter ATP-binding protein n=1 Tax=Candidatus Roizmanbacteria bacterium RIFCSPLOWO2_01_FULL_45_11 TaxID=1802070 RepID=A0A1F7JC65_9BACT|nr:MAG: macrolide ABC transporter ATP-binding protein [Candidatus Roizmanbacteria bacterium RIFCSPLOWO2_01_FULL_45_11]